MRKKFSRLKFATLAALAGAFLLASCSQTQTQVPEDNPVVNEPPKPIQLTINGVAPGDVLSGTVPITVSINEDSQVTEVEAYVDDILIGKYQITTASVAPLALSYDFNLNTAACAEAYVGSAAGTGCSPSDTSPVFLNGNHTVRVVAKNSEETKEVAVDVTFNNADQVLLELSGNSAQDAAGYTWYGGQDLTLTAYPVVYSNKQVSAVEFGGWASWVFSAIIPPSSNDVDLGAGAGVPVVAPFSGGSASVVVPKALNDVASLNPVSGGVQFGTIIRYSDGTYGNTNYVDYAIDFVEPAAAPAYYVLVNGLYSDTTANVVAATSGFLNGASPITYPTADVSPGVGGVVYQIEVLDGGSNVVATLNPGDTLAAAPEGGPYTFQVANLADALGNTPATPYGPSVAFNLDKTAPTLASTFGANGMALNGTAGVLNTIDGTITETGSGYATAFGAEVTDTSIGLSGMIVEVTYGGCTYELNGGLTWPAGAYSLDMTASTSATVPTGCAAYMAPTNTGGDDWYSVRFYLIDNARNISDPVDVSFYWLTTPPTLTFNTALPATVTLGGSPYADASSSISISSPVNILQAILYATVNGATFNAATDIQVVAPGAADVANGAPITWAPTGVPSSTDFYDFTANTTSFAFTMRFNASAATGTWDIVASAVPEAYDNTGAIDVSNLDNQTSQTVLVNP